MSSVQTLTSETFNVAVTDPSTPILVEFTADWCGPCKRIAPILDEIATENEGLLRVAKIDADLHPSLLQKFNVRGIPTMLLFKNGQVAKQIVGARSKTDLLLEIGVL